MRKLWPYIGIALAVAIGVALAPYIGLLLLFVFACAIVAIVALALRPLWPLAIMALLLVAVIAGVRAIIHDPHSTAGQWSEILIGLAVLNLVYAVITGRRSRRSIETVQ